MSRLTRALALATCSLLVACGGAPPPTPTSAPPAKAAAPAPTSAAPAPSSAGAAPTSAAPAPTKPAPAAAAPAKSGGAGCPFATRADAAAALGKDSMEGTPEGSDKCFFAAADTRAAPATEYVDVAVTRHDSEGDAKILLEATSGRTGAEKLSGLGDAAVFVKEDNGGQILALKGKTTVLTGVQSKAQSDPRGALLKLTQAVLAKS